jgi:hypothetical protein
MEKQQSYYCTLHRKYFFVAVKTKTFIKLDCYSTTFFLKQLQFSVEYFNQLLKDKKIILQP